MTTIALLLLACRAVPLAETPPIQAFELGQEEGAGNVVAVQAWMDPSAYASEQNFDRRLREHLDEAQRRGWLQEDTLVVLPEQIASWLFLIGEPARVIEADTAEQAMRRLVPEHLVEFLALTKDAPAEDPYQFALFAFNADTVAEVWQRVSSTIAIDYGITLFAGSAWLPGPELVDGQLRVSTSEPMRNVGLVVGPDGEILGDLTMKVFPSSGEQLLVQPGDIADLRTVPTSLGEIAVLLGEDAWYPDAWRAVHDSKPVVAISPYWSSPLGAWADRWGGYSGFERPPDVPREDEKELLLSEAFFEHGLPGRIADHGVSEGVTVPLRGRLFDLDTDGAIIGVLRSVATEGPLVDAPVLMNLWLPKAD